MLRDIAANARRSKIATPISPIAFEAVRRIDGLFDIEREINGLSAAGRLAVRQERGTPLVAALEGWMRAERAKLSRHNAVAKAIDYMLTRWQAFTRFLDDGAGFARRTKRPRATPYAAQASAAGSRGYSPDRSSEAPSAPPPLMYIGLPSDTAKLNDVDLQAWLADVLARIADHPVHRLDELLPWNWAVERQRRNLAA